MGTLNDGRSDMEDCRPAENDSGGRDSDSMPAAGSDSEGYDSDAAEGDKRDKSDTVVDVEEALSSSQCLN